MNPQDARAKLLDQHDQLRNHMATCVRLAVMFRDGESVTADLDVSLDLLRRSFAEHNETEQAIIARLLGGPAQWGVKMIERMVEEHIAEHAAFWELLSGTRTEVAMRIQDLAEELDAHMAAEERTFLSPGTLREDTIRTRTH
jgi:iron-sulfur cluster repair protein YtfE (RIC family)